MVRAQRGDVLDFSSVPVDKRMPVFFPETPQRATSYRLHPERLKKMEAFRHGRKLKKKRHCNGWPSGNPRAISKRHIC